MPRDHIDLTLRDQQLDFGPRMQRLYATDISQKPEFYLRNAIIFVVTLFVAWLMKSWTPITWMGVYFTSIAAYYAFLTKAKDRAVARRAHWHQAVAISTFATCWYTVLPLYLWMMPNLALNFIAWCALFGMAMLNLTRHTFDWTLAYIDMVVVSLSILFMGGSWAYQSGFGGEGALILSGTFACAAYYAMAHRDGLVLRNKVLNNERRAAESAKMQAVGQLTTGIAHDFNNLLTVVIGNIELARIADSLTDQQESLDEAHKAADRAAILVSQLLAFSRRAQLCPVAINADEFASAFVATIERLLPASIILRHHVAPGVGHLLCDRNLLDSALLNLVINARDAMQGRGNISLIFRRVRRLPAELVAQSPQGAFVSITLADTGPGIPRNLIGRVTDPFFTTKPIGKGSGLGLAMVKGFSEQSGGALNITASPAGTEITIFLPAAPDFDLAQS